MPWLSKENKPFKDIYTEEVVSQKISRLYIIIFSFPLNKVFVAISKPKEKEIIFCMLSTHLP